MIPITLRLRYAIGLWLLAVLCSSAWAQKNSVDGYPSSVVTIEFLKTKIQEVEAESGIEEEAQTRLLELYRESLDNLRMTSSYKAAEIAFQQAAESAPVEVRVLRDEMDELSVADASTSLQVDLSTPLQQIEQILQREQINLAADDSERADFKKRLREEVSRPVLIRQRLAEAKREQEELAGQFKLAPPADESPALTEARRWVFETRHQMLSNEIKALDQELLSQPMRLDLLKIKRELAAVSVVQTRKRINMLEDLVSLKRQAEAEQGRTQAEMIRREAEGKHPLVVRLAEQNAVLYDEIADMASGLGKLTQQVEEADQMARQIDEDFRGANDIIQIGGLSQELGQMLLQQRQSLPDLKSFHRQAVDRKNKAAEIGVRRLKHRREQKRLRDPQAYISGIISAGTAEEVPLLRQQLADLAMKRKRLLEQAVESDDEYLRELGELESIQQRLLKEIEDYDAFLDQYLPWLRSTSRTQLRELGALPEQVWRIISPSGWLEVVNALIYQATHSPAFVLLALVLGTLLWIRRRLIRLIQAMSDRLGKATTDRFVFSLEALALSLLAAALLPLVFAVTGWQLEVSAEATDFTNAVGASLKTIAAQFFALRALRIICIPDGLAAAHFHWPESSLQLLRKELDRLTWIYLPAFLVSVIAFYLDPLNFGWAIGRAAFVIMVGTLGVAFYRLLHPKYGVLAGYMHQPDRTTFRGFHRLWYPLLVAAPLTLIALSLMGYVYTAGILTGLLLQSAWLLVCLIIIAALAKRWLLVTRRQLRYQAALVRRQAILEAQKEQAESGSGAQVIHADAEKVDLVALTDTTQKLLNTTIIFSGIVGLWLIWSGVFPALHYFDAVTLWQLTVSIGGEEQVRSVTLANLGSALIYLAATVVLSKQLPAVLNIIFLEHTQMSAGSRYTFTTLTNYAIVFVGGLLAIDTIGGEWSQLQWLVAALSVGIGFGLQEIVANFICGLIILFERPVRVGDLITVGDASGKVMRIRIRSTTIRDFEQKELLIPNKELITGRLLNWTLSDETTRILIQVGIAYGSDVDRAMEILLELADEDERVLNEPEPGVAFDQFADSSLNLSFRVYVGTLADRLPVMTDMHRKIHRRFAEEGIIIAFPQCDVHIHAGDMQAAMSGSREANAEIPA